MGIRNIGTVLLCLAMFAAACGTSTAQTVQPDTAAQVIERAETQSRLYVEAFKNLLADETRTFDEFDKNGNPRRARTVRSSFLVYQPINDAEHAIEFRNVLEVDGKPVKNVDQRAQNFFEKVLKANNAGSEMSRIRDESERFDQGVKLNGLTLYQAVSLWPEIRDKFSFRLIGEAQMDGHKVLIIEYRQITASQNIVINKEVLIPAKQRSLSLEIEADTDGELNARLNGTLTVDADTGQLRRETREFTVQPSGAREPMIAVREEFQYQDSTFSILTPKRITHEQYRINAKHLQSIKEDLVTFEYGNFSRADVQVKAGDVKQ